VANGLAWLSLALLGQSAGEDFFETKVRPVLAERCYGCHSAEAKKLKGGLRLDTPEGLRRVAGGPLLAAVRWADEDLRMPPDAKLPAAELADIETWIRQGAPLPAVKGRPSGPHWAFAAPKDPAPPSATQNPIDAFILSRLAEKGLALSPTADPRTLLRRAAYDLTASRRPPRSSTPSWPTPPPTRTRRPSTASSPRPATASAGRGTGWTSRATPTPPTATSTATSIRAWLTRRPTATG
jgi:hypothetical protein